MKSFYPQYQATLTLFTEWLNVQNLIMLIFMTKAHKESRPSSFKVSNPAISLSEETTCS
jgi:hypothetical protein